MKKYVYFVSAVYSRSGGMVLFHAEEGIGHRITKLEDINEIAGSLRKRIGCGHAPTILNYKLLRVEEEGGSDA